MKHLHIFFSISLFLLVAVGCSPKNLSYNEALERNSRKLDTDAQRNDATFLVDAANYNLVLLDLSSKATQQGYARIVTDFATMSTADHQRMQEDLKKLAKEKKMSLPAMPSDRFQQYTNELTTTDKRSFDKNYLNTIEALHEQAIRMFESAALNANDSNIRAFAAAKLDVLRAHERKADELENQLL